MSALFTIQAVVLVVGGYLIGVGFFRRRWMPLVSDRRTCANRCHGPVAALRNARVLGEPHSYPVLYCRECADWSMEKRDAERRGALAWFWPVAGIGKVAMAVVRLGESLADMETKP